jgi:hypothetical protein
MTVTFTAKFVRCVEMLDGDILQVWFDTTPESDGEDERGTSYLLIGQNFEFPGPATVQWHDGRDYAGGAEIVSVRLTRDRALIKLDRDLEIDVSFHIGERQFAQLSSYLRRLLDEDVFAT